MNRHDPVPVSPDRELRPVLVTPLLLGLLDLTTGLEDRGWAAGLLTGWALTALVVLGRVHSGDRAVLPADWVTASYDAPTKRWWLCDSDFDGTITTASRGAVRQKFGATP